MLHSIEIRPITNGYIVSTYCAAGDTKTLFCGSVSEVCHAVGDHLRTEPEDKPEKEEPFTESGDYAPGLLDSQANEH